MTTYHVEAYQYEPREGYYTILETESESEALECAEIAVESGEYDSVKVTASTGEVVTRVARARVTK